MRGQGGDNEVGSAAKPGKRLRLIRITGILEECIAPCFLA
jgi:hypothetical protein